MGRGSRIREIEGKRERKRVKEIEWMNENQKKEWIGKLEEANREYKGNINKLK